MSEKREKAVVCIGAAVVDCIVRDFVPERLPSGGYYAGSEELSPGGDAVNQSVTFSKLGKKARIVCFTGKDDAAEILMHHLKAHGVDTSFCVKPEDARTPVAVIFVDQDGDRRSIMNAAHRYNFHPEKDMSCMDGAEAVSLCSLFRAPFDDPEIIRTVVSEAKRRGLPVYADTKLANAAKIGLSDLKESLPMIDCIFPNEGEAKFYTGRTEPEEMAQVFLDLGVKNVAIKLGSRGCLFKNADEQIFLPSFPVKAVDATGAGDNFAAGFITMCCEGRSFADALLFANACGAVCTTGAGAAAALQSREQVEALIRSCR